jgi:hypothetical protein
MQHQTVLKTTAYICVAAILSACGGGGGSSSTSSTSTTSSSTLTGVAATGAPFDGATVIITDSTGATVGTATTNPDGSYEIKFDPSKFTAPFVATVTGNIGEATESLVSVIPGGSLAAEKNITANITPITNAIASRISSTGNPLSLVDSIATEKANISSANVVGVENSFRTLLESHLTSVGLSSSFNLINSTFTSSFDKLLDNIKLDTSPTGQITMTSSAGQAVDDLSNSATTPNAGSSLIIPSGSLPTAANSASIPTLPSGSSVIGIDVLETIRTNLNSCYALPVSTRTGSTECNSLISSDYKNDGRSKAVEFGATSPLNLSDASNTNMTFMKPEILRQLTTTPGNERLVVRMTGMRRADLTDGTAGTTRSLVSVAQNSPTGWKLVGNQRDFNTFINAAASKRIFANNTGWNRYETGLNIYLQGNTGMSKAVVTGPGLPVSGITLFNRSECDFLSISPDGINPPTNCAGYYRLNAKRINGTSFTITGPTAYLFASDSSRKGSFFTDDEIRTEIPPNSLYKFVITKADNTTVTYWNRLRSQPLQTADLARVNYVDFKPETVALMTTGTIYSGGAGPTVAWTTPPNTARPYKVTFFHPQGTDERNVPFSVASTQIRCSVNDACLAGSSGSYNDTVDDELVNPSDGKQYLFQLISRNRFDLQLFTQLSR